MNDNPNAFWQRTILVFLAIIALMLLGRALFVPDSWGELGYYRADSIKDELAKPLVHGQNESCQSCHAEVYDMKQHSVHARLACESCHAPVSTHVDASGEKIGDMPHKLGEPQVELCLSCHQKTLGRPEKFPMIEYPAHIEEQNVHADHTCDQCHTVHAPLENIKKARGLFKTLKQEVEDANQ